MKTKIVSLTLAAVVLLASAAVAQGRRGWQGLADSRFGSPMQPMWGGSGGQRPGPGPMLGSGLMQQGLGLTDDQRERIRGIRSRFSKDLASILKKESPGKDRREHLKQLTERASREVMDVLTAEQKNKILRAVIMERFLQPQGRGIAPGIGPGGPQGWGIAPRRGQGGPQGWGIAPRRGLGGPQGWGIGPRRGQGGPQGWGIGPRRGPGAPQDRGAAPGTGSGGVTGWLDSLNLSDEQKTSIKDIMADRAQKAEAIREDTKLTQEQKRTQLEELRADTRKRVNEALTPDQRKQLEQRQQQMRPGQKGSKTSPGQMQEPEGQKPTVETT